MKTLYKLLLSLSLALPLAVTQAQEASAITGTKKLSEAQSEAKEATNKYTKILNINRDDLKRQMDSLNSTASKLSKVLDDSSIPTSRKKIMQKQYLASQEEIIKSIIETFDKSSEDVLALAEKYQDSISGADAAAKYLKRFEEASAQTETTKQNGRRLVVDLEKAETELQGLERTDPDYLDTFRKVRRLKQEATRSYKSLIHQKKKSQYLAQIADVAERSKVTLAKAQDAILQIIDNFDTMRMDYEFSLEMVQLQKEAVSLGDLPASIAGLNETMSTLSDISTQLGQTELMMPIIDDQEISNLSFNSTLDISLEDMKKAFYE